MRTQMIYLQRRHLASIALPCGGSVNGSVRATREPQMPSLSAFTRA